eukprot:scaffold243552_cov32-Tisochrysis_lutea.AAC.8
MIMRRSGMRHAFSPSPRHSPPTSYASGRACPHPPHARMNATRYTALRPFNCPTIRARSSGIVHIRPCKRQGHAQHTNETPHICFVIASPRVRSLPVARCKGLRRASRGAVTPRTPLLCYPYFAAARFRGGEVSVGENFHLLSPAKRRDPGCSGVFISS